MIARLLTVNRPSTRPNPNQLFLSKHLLNPSIQNACSVPRSSWRETQGYDQQPFKEVPTPALNKTMKANLVGFHPFTPNLMGTRLPQKWKWPSLKKYNGRLDPKAHIKPYSRQTNLFSEDLVVHCRLFPTTFSVAALKRYYYPPRIL